MNKTPSLISRIRLARATRAQMELSIARPLERDRNWHKGGRSFYFFDFDDNIAVLSTPIYLIHRDSRHELALSSREFAQHSRHIGKSGRFAEYTVELDDMHGSFRNFRDRDFSLLERLLGKKQVFLQDLAHALGYHDFEWKGPSWDCFFHAVFNKRPVSLITARGHHPETIQQGIQLLVRAGHLPYEPNYLSVLPVSHPEIMNRLRSKGNEGIAELKQAAIRESVKQALNVYGESPHHRFGMSDDDPKNIALIVEEMARLKSEYKDVSFFVIDTSHGRLVKRQVFADHTEDSQITAEEQLALF